MITFRRITWDDVPWNQLDAFWDRTVFQTREWLQYVSGTRQAQPVIAEVLDDSDTVGYFTGMISTHVGIRILGSPLPGWTTPYMGFNLEKTFPRSKALKALVEFAFRELRCLHLEVCDRYLQPEDGAGLGFRVSRYGTYVSDLSKTDEQVFASMTSACRRNIRKAQRMGVRVEEARDDFFADEYYAHLVEVFAKRQRRPTYTLQQVRKLITCIQPTGRLLLLRARDPKGQCIATGIFPGFNRISQFWGNGSTKDGLLLRPNELIHWSAMRYWQAHGLQWHDWGGGGSYKEKYGGTWTEVPRFIKSAWTGLHKVRELVRLCYRAKSRAAFLLLSFSQKTRTMKAL